MPSVLRYRLYLLYIYIDFKNVIITILILLNTFIHLITYWMSNISEL